MHPDLYWEDGTPAKLEEAKYAVQMTDQDAVCFTRKVDALNYIAICVRDLKSKGWTVSGKSDAKICYRGEESLSILLTARRKNTQSD